MASSGTKASRECASRDEEQDRRAVGKGAGQHSRRSALPRAAAFWLRAWALCLLFSASGAPSLLCAIHQAQLRFPVATLTAVYAVYALGLLITLLSFGSVSDYLGRRVILAASRSARARAGCSWR